MKVINVECPGWRSAPGQASATAMAVLARPDDDKATGGRAVFIAIVKCPASDAQRAETAEWVMIHGTKLRLAHAQIFFPALTPRTYG